MPKDFASNVITDHDIRFILRLSQDSSDWEALEATKKNTRERDYYAYMSRSDYSIGGTENMRLGKFTGYLPCSAARMIETISDVVGFTEHTDPNIVGMASLGYEEAGEGVPYPIHYYDTMMRLPFPYAMRRCSMLTSTVYDNVRQCYIVIMKSTTLPLPGTYPLKLIQTCGEMTSGAVGLNTEKLGLVDSVLIDAIFGYVIYEVSDSKCRYVNAFYLNPHTPMMINSIFKYGIKARASKFHAALVGAIQHKPNTNDSLSKINKYSYDSFIEKNIPTSNSIKTWIV